DDHRIFGTPVLPAAAYLELAMAAGRELSEPKPVAVRELSILEPLQLDRPRVLQTIVGAGTAREIEIVSRPADRPDGPWVTHAKGRLSAEPVDASSSTWSAADVDGNPIDVEAYYARLREAGAEYGPAFKGLVSLESGTDCARAVIRA